MKTCPQCHQRYPVESSFCFIDGSVLVAENDPLIGTTIAGRYVIEEALGTGGMATVYRARHKLVDRFSALKILNVQLAQDPTTRERFRREAKHAQRVAHPNIIEVFDQGDTDDGIPFLAMDLLEGATLADVIKRGRVPLARALPIWIQMARALGRAHDFDVVHRDLKPENVFLLKGDRVKLLDFGIARCAQDARLTNMGEVFGTPQYMAPERATSIDAGPPADLYALGVMMFEMMTQKLPFDATDPAGWVMKHSREPPPRLQQVMPEAPDALDRLVFWLMAKAPSDRPIDAHRVLSEIKEVAAEAGVALPPEPDEASLEVSAAPQGVGRDPWDRRAAVLERMLGHGFPSGPPADFVRVLESLKAHVWELGELRARALEEQERLEGVERDGRDGRMQLGRAMDQLATDASITREEARRLRARVTSLSLHAQTFVPEVLLSHKEMMLWEGRSGFAEPYRELAAGYRKMANLVDHWYEARKAELEAEAEAAGREREIAEVNEQIKELRSRLEQLDMELEARRHESQGRIAEMGRRADQLEIELLHLASRFCAPLRAKPELGQLFIELGRLPS